MGQAGEYQVKEPEAAAILMRNRADLSASAPQIDQPQGEPEPQQAPPRRSGGRSCADLMALPVPALDPETPSVILKDLLERDATHSVDRISEVSDVALAKYATHDHDLRRVRRLGRAPERLTQSLMPIALKVLFDAARAAPRRKGNDVRPASRSQATEDGDAGEPLIEIGALDSHARLARDLQQPRHDGRHRFALLDEGHGDGQALPRRND